MKSVRKLTLAPLCKVEWGGVKSGDNESHGKAAEGAYMRLESRHISRCREDEPDTRY